MNINWKLGVKNTDASKNLDPKSMCVKEVLYVFEASGTSKPHKAYHQSPRSLPLANYLNLHKS